MRALLNADPVSKTFSPAIQGSVGRAFIVLLRTSRMILMLFKRVQSEDWLLKERCVDLTCWLFGRHGAVGKGVFSADGVARGSEPCGADRSVFSRAGHAGRDASTNRSEALPD